MYSNKSLKIILVALCVLIFIVSVLCYLVFEDIRNKNENRHTLLYGLSLQNSKQSYLVSTREMINSINHETEHINNSIIFKGGEVEFIENLESIARENGLSIEIDSLVFENNPNLTSNSIDILRIKAKTNGTWSGSYRFLSQLESLPIKIKVDKFSFVNIETETVTGGKNSVWQNAFEIEVLKYK